ncbi:MAG: peptide ABC transporter substrate-binding protein [Rhodospirillales bacterium]|nr:MAG: peptide ABC transporter substrate-binding protein [Rhodospirillales bacterium]
MRNWLVTTAAIGAALAAACLGGAASAQKSGGTLRMYFHDNAPSGSIHEEATNSTVVPFMPVYNNLVLFDQQVARNSEDTVRPDLAESWAWNADKSQLAFKLRAGVKWHDGKPFTAADVKCTWDLVRGEGAAKLRKNPRKTWYENLDKVVVDGELAVTFHLKRPQPSFIILLASGYSPVYPCHATPADMRTKPVGTGPFKFVEFKQNEHIKLVRNPDYFKKGKPHLDAIEYSIVPNRSTAILGFVSNRFDITAPYAVTIPLLKDVRSQSPAAVCSTASMNNSTNLIVNRESPPFDDERLRRAMMLSIDRKAFVEILNQGDAIIGGVMQPTPDGNWGMPQAMFEQVKGYGPDVAKNREEGRAIMRSLGYGPDKRLKIKVSTRNHLLYRDPAVIFADQLKEVYFDAELDLVDTAAWFTKVARKDYSVGLNTTGNGVDDPDQTFFEHYACGSERNYTNYCNRELQEAFVRQSSELDPEKRRKMVWDIDRRLLEDAARPIIMWNRSGSCWHPRVKGYVPMVNSLYNGFRFEDVWLDQ